SVGVRRACRPPGKRPEPPLADGLRAQLANGHVAQVRLDVFGQQPAVEIDGPDPQAGPLCDPVARIVAEPGLAALRVSPFACDYLGLDERPCPLGIALAVEGLRMTAQASIRAGIANLVAARRQPADVAEAPVSLLVGHQAALLGFGAVRGSISRAAMNSRSADSGMRTWPRLPFSPRRTKRIRRSGMRRRGTRSEVPSSWADWATVSSRSFSGNVAHSLRV